ncbi:MAG: hypothetical protein JRI23_19280 [Deltaproteobacteria bacterium]|jgi:hypothetical protein|nr:hypothetical protein [Deltaproteobacteria bacterium]MBW2534008.1 hypothetical protein [Deltaproteobacteria bacterium]
MRTAILTGMLACAALACGSSFTADDGGGGRGGSGGGSAGSGGATCDAGAACVPAGWSGPVTLLEGGGSAAPPTCPAEMPSEIAVAHAGLEAADSECSVCSCGTPAATCSGAAHPTSSCSVITDTQVISETCSSYGTPIAGIDFRTAPTLSGPTDPCPAYGGEVTDTPTVTWTRHVRVCGAAASIPSCSAGGSCVPSEDPDHTLCIVQSGEHPCPASTPFVVRSVAYQDVTDDRGCSPCVCGTPDCSASQVSVYSEQGCSSSELVDTVAVGACELIVGSSARLELIASCAPSGGLPSGAAAPSEPLTLCCAD